MQFNFRFTLREVIFSAIVATGFICLFYYEHTTREKAAEMQEKMDHNFAQIVAAFNEMHQQ